MKTYTIGTRGSLLALTQCEQVRRELEKKTGDRFELKVFKTEGDLQQQNPLWQMPGKDFFTKELDRALLEGEVDLTVHSCKDLSTQRPAGIHLAAITERHFGEDILLVRKEVAQTLQSFQGPFIIGTSAPRRTCNLKRSLAEFLPFGEGLTLELRPLRGNVNTRLEKLGRGDYHAIVLALAGLERLAREENPRLVLEKLLEGLSFMLLPPSHFPFAAGQGALAIECLQHRRDGGELRAKLEGIEHPQTRREIERERKDFRAYGGGCHLAVGICARTLHNDLYVVHRGEYQGQLIKKQIYQRKRRPFSGGQVFIGLPASGKIPEIRDALTRKIPHPAQLPDRPHHLLIASRYSVESLAQSGPPSRHFLWASGAQTAKRLARAGFWMNGCLDGLSEERWPHYLNSRALQLITATLSSLILTHGNAYRREVRPARELAPDYPGQLGQCQAFFWSSFPQYQAFCRSFPFIKNKFHATGPGKTWHKFRQEGIDVELFANVQDFRDWVAREKR